MKHLRQFSIFVCLVLSLKAYGQLDWPEISGRNKPWTRWWWLGSAVDTGNISILLEQYAQAGLGGLEIVPVYGTRGYENNYLPYLSAAWMNALEFTLCKAGKLDLGIDMANGTGWPFGGPYVNDANAAACLFSKTYQVREGESITEEILFHQPEFLKFAGKNKTIPAKLKRPVSLNDSLQLMAIDQIRFPDTLKALIVMAYNESGQSSEITQYLDHNNNKLNWKAPSGNWKVIALFYGQHGKMVERAAPGGEGYALDHFSKEAVSKYLQHFDTALASIDIRSLRCFFNDSYEVDDARGQADWTANMLNEFKVRRGYDLRDHLPALLGSGPEDLQKGIIYDYRLTLSEIMLDNFTITWKNWAHGKGALIRNQAHGSPANILDLYGASDIPETEGREILRFKFASSAGNVTGKSLISAEAATWLDDHFLSTLADIKRSADRYFLGGVNHLIYHGTAYSPVTDPWPGWLFYAAVHFQPTNPFWTHFPALNKYVARCQSFLQQGQADNDVLLYFPVADRFADRGEQLLRHFDGIDKEFNGTGFKESAEDMLKRGYAFDFISDLQMRQASIRNNEILCGVSSYKTIIIPGCYYMPLKTWQHLFKLAAEGARIIFFRQLPEDIPGLANREQDKNLFMQLTSVLEFKDTGLNGIKQARCGKGSFVLGNNLNELLAFCGIRRESMTDQQLQFVRRKIDDHEIYLIVNQANTDFEGWVPVQCKAASVGLFDAMSVRTGIALSRQLHEVTEVYIRLTASGSIILKAFAEPINGGPFDYANAAGAPVTLKGAWRVEFVEGGPVMPAARIISELTSWTGWKDPELQKFSGVAKYSFRFNMPRENAARYLLDLGTVKESADIRINGISIAILPGDDFRTIIDAGLLKKKNLLEIRVANSMANRIIYMDKQGIPYKKFYNINFPANDPANTGSDGLFSSAGWEPLPSGLLGPVTLTPLK